MFLASASALPSIGYREQQLMQILLLAIAREN
jgi:hypothetical protein